VKSTIEIALKKTELEARIARPETRWLHENESGGQVGGEAEAGDKEALNVMAERRWRKMGKLDRLVSLVFLSPTSTQRAQYPQIPLLLLILSGSTCCDANIRRWNAS